MWQHPHVRRAWARALFPLVATLSAAAPIFAVTPARAVDQNVGILNFAYQPADVSVGLNERVTWFNQSADPHTVTSDTGVFDSGSLAPYGGGYQVMFQRAGTFPYHCAFHPQMRGVVRVAGGGTTPPPPPPPVTTRPGSPPTTARPPGATPPPPGPFATTTSTSLGAATTSSSTSSTSSSSTTSTTSLFSPPTTTRAAGSDDDGDDDTQRRIAGGIAAALAVAGTLATIFVARRPAGPPGGYGSY